MLYVYSNHYRNNVLICDFQMKPAGIQLEPISALYKHKPCLVPNQLVREIDCPRTNDWASAQINICSIVRWLAFFHLSISVSIVISREVCEASTCEELKQCGRASACRDSSWKKQSQCKSTHKQSKKYSNVQLDIMSWSLA